MPATKHYVDDPVRAVQSALRALSKTNPALSVDLINKIVYQRRMRDETMARVSVVAGGGSGHEPGWSGFVGRGLCTAAIAGNIFASPSSQQILQCLRHCLPVDSQGVLVIVLNYTGDVLNFGLAVEKERAQGRAIEMVVVGDDVAVGRAKNGRVGRRGLSGAILVAKICGAWAKYGMPLEECAQAGKHVAGNLISIGASLGRTHVPGQGSVETDDEKYHLGLGCVEIGMGIHNEPGCERSVMKLPCLIKTMLKLLLSSDDQDRAYLNISPQDPVVLMLNNLGGISTLELGAILDETLCQLDAAYRIVPRRVYQGTFLSSLNAPGFIITLLKATDSNLTKTKDIFDALDMPVDATGWSSSTKCWSRESDEDVKNTYTEAESTVVRSPGGLRLKSSTLKSCLKPALLDLIDAEAEITRYDTIIGDGDCGLAMKRGAEAVLTCIDRLESNNLVRAMSSICTAIESSMDGTSGAVCAIFLNALALNMQNEEQRIASVQDWAKGLVKSLEHLQKYTSAQPGDRTMLDALVPFVNCLKNDDSNLVRAANMAKEGAERTKGMQPTLGRAVYVGGRAFEEVPDPGAFGLSVFLTALAAHAGRT